MLDARGDGNVPDRVPVRPLQSRGDRWILVLTSADLFDDSGWKQDCGSEALDQIEPTNAGEQDEW